MNNLLTEGILKFQLGDKIGGGGEGEIFKAYDTQLNAELAIKRLDIKKMTNPIGFFEESRKLYLTRHHNVVDVNYACKDDDFIYLAMPLYKKGSLKSLTDTRFLTSREIIRYSLQFLSGLNNIHSKQLIHFDIKTENILLSDSNQALVSDFGVAQYMGAYGFAQNKGVSLQYAPPELFTQSKHDLKFDIYQAGLAMYRMCNGDANFMKQLNLAATLNGKSAASNQNFIDALKKGAFPDRKYYLPHIPKILKKVINTALEVDIQNRHSSVIAFLNEISKIDAVNDWQYSIDSLNNEKWECFNKIITCTQSGNYFEIISLKKGAKQTRKNDYCKKSLSEKDKNALLYKCLNEAW